MIIQKFGETIDCSTHPIDGVKLALRAAAGCGSRSNAWSWAKDAVQASRFHSIKLAENIEKALGIGRFPDVQAAESVVEKLIRIEPTLIYVSKHISGGYLLGVPHNNKSANDLADVLSVWQNSPSIENHNEYEFSSDLWRDTDTFETWVKITFSMVSANIKTYQI
jgi:hypothetical protein